MSTKCISQFFSAVLITLSKHAYILFHRLELDNRVAPNAENTEKQEDNPVSVTTEDSEIPFPLKTAFFIYKQAFDRIKDIKFIVELLNITKEYDNIEPLQKRIIWYIYMLMT